MGIVFVILIHLVLIFFISSITGLIWIILICILSKSKNRTRKIIFAGLTPYVGLYSLYFFVLFGSIIVSQLKGVDEGIGDCWYVTIKDKCNLTFIDLPEQSYLKDDDKTIIEGIACIQQEDYKLTGVTHDSIFFSYDINSKAFQRYKSETELLKANNKQKFNLIKAIDYYSDKKDEVAGTSLILVGIISIILTIFILFGLKKLIIRNKQIDNNILV